MNTGQFELHLRQFARTGAEIDQRMRRMREVGLLPKVRGRHAPHITPAEAAWAILSLVSRRASEAGEIAQAAAELKTINSPDLTPQKDQKFLPYLIGALSDRYADNPAIYSLKRLEIVEDGSMARAEYVVSGGQSFHLLFSNNRIVRKRASVSTQAYDDEGWRDECDRRLIIGKGFLRRTATLIALENQPQEPLGISGGSDDV